MKITEKDQIYINQVLAEMRMHHEDKKFKNCIRLPYNTTQEHDEKMCYVCSKLMRNPEKHRIIFWTECRIGTGRADIFYINLDLRLHGVIEVLVTEEDDNLVSKANKYNCVVIPYRDGDFDYKRTC